MEGRLYTVTSQREIRDFDQAGNAYDAIEVSYVAAGDIGGRVRLSKAYYTPANVDATIRADLQPKLEVAQLGDR